MPRRSAPRPLLVVVKLLLLAAALSVGCVALLEVLLRALAGFALNPGRIKEAIRPVRLLRPEAALW